MSLRDCDIFANVRLKLLCTFVFRTFDQMKEVMEVGVPELGIPVLEPVTLDQVEFKFFNLTVQFIDLVVRGLKSSQLLTSNLSKTTGYRGKLY